MAVSAALSAASSGPSPRPSGNIRDGFLRGEDVIQVGMGTGIYGEKYYEQARNDGTTVHHMHEIQRDGLKAVMDKVLKKLEGKDITYLTLDIDVLAMAYVPGTNEALRRSLHRLGRQGAADRATVVVAHVGHEAPSNLLEDIEEMGSGQLPVVGLPADLGRAAHVVQPHSDPDVVRAQADSTLQDEPCSKTPRLVELWRPAVLRPPAAPDRTERPGSGGGPGRC